MTGLKHPFGILEWNRRMESPNLGVESLKTVLTLNFPHGRITGRYHNHGYGRHRTPCPISK